MKIVLLALMLCAAVLAVAPEASACPDLDRPCPPRLPVDPPRLPSCSPYAAPGDLLACLTTPLP